MCGSFGFVTFKALADAQVAMGLTSSKAPAPVASGGGGNEGGGGSEKGKGKKKGRKSARSSGEAREAAAAKAGWHMAAVVLNGEAVKLRVQPKKVNEFYLHGLGCAIEKGTRGSLAGEGSMRLHVVRK